MNLQVIGGSGFIGTSLCARLSRAKTIKFKILDLVCGLSFSGHTKLADVRSLEDLRNSLNKGEPIINLAAEHRDDVSPKSLYESVNVGGAKNICTIAREKEINTIIFTSSVAVYGFAPPGTNESGAIVPFNEYGRTKWEAEQVYQKWQAEDPQRRTLVIIRPTVVLVRETEAMFIIY